MQRRRFERLVAEAIDGLPEPFKEKLDNVAIVVQSVPTAEEAGASGPHEGLLLGLYQGQPLTERDSRYGLAIPDRITIYQRNVEAICRGEAEIREQVRITVLHEIAHHFGIDDDRLDDLGL
jgi:predicted Zn-dependent protease with MMP-like domain